MTTKPAAVPDEIAHYDTIAGQDALRGAKATQRNRARSVVFSVRLNPEEVTEIEKVAADLDVPASTLVRGWVLSGLATHRESDALTELQRVEEGIKLIRRRLQGGSATRDV